MHAGDVVLALSATQGMCTDPKVSCLEDEYTEQIVLIHQGHLPAAHQSAGPGTLLPGTYEAL